ncbi:MAG: PKD domain-containing protein, partial [Bacteroidota bacterium]
IAPITGGSITGDITVQRFINSGATNWRFLSSPVSGINFEEWDDDFITSGFTGSDFPTFPFTSIFTYDETVGGVSGNGFVPLSNSSSSINVGEGYWVWSGDTITGTQPFIIDVTGTANTGTINLPVSFTSSGGATEDGWAMVGNPYASPIDWDSPGWTKVNMANAIYIWDPDIEQYATYIAGAGTNGGSAQIAQGQAFWVQATGSSPQLTATESVKTGNDPFFFKDANAASQQVLRLKVSGTGLEDEAVIRFHDQATDGYDQSFDARKVLSTHPAAPNLSSVNAGEELTVNSLAALKEDIAVPIRLLVGISGTYTLDVTGLDAFTHVGCLVLEDRLTGTRTDLLTYPSYSFFMADTTQAPRFLLHVAAPLSASTAPVSCFDATDGRITVDGKGTGPWTFTWTNEDGNVLLTASGDSSTLNDLPAGTYYTEVTGQGFCPVREISHVLEAPAPVLPSFTSSHDTLYLDQESEVVFTNLSQGATTYRWDFGDGTVSNDTTPVHQYYTPGNYAVLLTATREACSESTAQPIVVLESQEVSVEGPPTGITENALNELIRIYPEGDAHVVAFRFEQRTDVAISLRNNLGQLIYRSNAQGVTQDLVSLPTGSLASGVYIVALEFSGSSHTQKIFTD